MSQNYSNIVAPDKVMGYKEMYEQAQSMYERAASISEDISEDMNALIEGTISGAYTNSGVSVIRDFVFYNCSSLTAASFSKCTTIGGAAFISCSALSEISFPNCTSIGTQAFVQCSALTTASFPKCTSIGYNAFASCTALTIVSFPECQTIGNFAFLKCNNLLSLYLLGSSVVTLGSTDAFEHTPMSTSVSDVYGSIFVPASLYASYISANNWSAYSSRIVSLTDEQISALE